MEHPATVLVRSRSEAAHCGKFTFPAGAVLAAEATEPSHPAYVAAARGARPERSSVAKNRAHSSTTKWNRPVQTTK